MTGFLQTVLAFVFALGVLVTFHEYGHYWVAKRLGVKILRFSVGFGRPLLQWRSGKDRTEFAIAAIPLGGYVKMLDEREGEVAPEDSHRAFNRQPVAVRAAIVSAGPLANFALAILVYWLSYLGGVTGPRPIIGTVAPDGLSAQAGLQPGDEIRRVNDHPVALWDNVLNHAIDAILDGEALHLAVEHASHGERQVTLNFSHFSIDDLSRGEFFDKAGFTPLRAHLPARVGRLIAGEAAAEAGLEAGDLLTTVDGKPIEDWVFWVETVRAHPGVPLSVELERSGQRLTVELTPRAAEEGGQRVGRIGAEVARPDAADAVPMATERYGPFESLTRAVGRTVEVTRTTLKFLGQMLSGRASADNLSGPLSIAQYAGESARLGPSRFLEFLGLVSVSLAVLNLLPVPMLDGGHLIFYLIESVARRPVPEAVQVYGQQLGLFLLLGLMGLALYNDLMRIF